VKYEEVYLRAYDSVADARASLGRYLDFYNLKRPQGCSTLFGGKGESSAPQVGAEQRRQADGRLPGSANL
jgi:hypothetical protein